MESALQDIRRKKFTQTVRLRARFSNALFRAMAQSYPTIIPGLRSPFDQVNGIVYFGRMLDKMRLAAAGKLPQGWQPMRGQKMKNSFDDRCCRFLGIDYTALEAETLKSDKTDTELLEWAFQHGHHFLFAHAKLAGALDQVGSNSRVPRMA